MHSYADLPDKNGVGGGRQTFQFSVHLDGHDRIDLETGEVFQNFGRSNNKNAISGHLTVGHARTEEDYTYNRMTYSEEIDLDDPMVSSPSQIFSPCLCRPAISKGWSTTFETVSCLPLSQWNCSMTFLANHRRLSSAGSPTEVGRSGAIETRIIGTSQFKESHFTMMCLNRWKLQRISLKRNHLPQNMRTPMRAKSPMH